MDSSPISNEEEKIFVLELVKTFLKSRKEDLKPQSLEEYNRELDQADNEIEAGEYVSHEEVMKKHLQ